MDNCTLSSTFEEDAYTIDMDAMCVTQDYDVASDIQYQLEQLAKEEDTDILFE